MNNPNELTPNLRRNNFDGTSQKLVKRSRLLMRKLLGLRIDVSQIKEIVFLSEVLQRSNELDVDAVALITFLDGSRAAFHLESQTENQDVFAFRMLDYRVTLRSYYPIPMPIYQLGMYIGEKPLTMSNVYEEYDGPSIEGIPRIPVLRFEVPILDIRQLDPQEFLTSGDPNCIIMALLMHERIDSEACNKIIYHLNALGLDKETLYSYLRDGYEFAFIRSARDTFNNAIMNNIIGIDPKLIEEDILYKQGIERGIERGRDEGRDENLKSLALKFVLTLNYDVPNAAQMLDVSEEQIHQWLEENK